MKLSRLANIVRTPAAILIIALEFTNLVAFWAEGGNRSAFTQHSRYPFQFAAYGLAALVLFLDQDALRRFVRKRIVHWSFWVLLLFTWSMVVRAFRAPIGYDDYDFVRYFGLRVNAIGFLLSCVLIFDDPSVLLVSRRSMAVATLVGVGFNLYDLSFPGLFSNIPGRGAGLYVQPNTAGMALIFGGLLSLTGIRRRWTREIFLFCVLVGVLASASRQAMLSFVLLAIGAAAAGVISFRRLAIAAVACVGLVIALDLTSHLSDLRVLNADSLARLTFQWSDDSERDRIHLADETLKQFEEAPLLGQGFGTAIFWSDDQSHNAYLGLLADCGILGILVIPSLIFSIRRKHWEFWTFAAIFLLWAFLYHDVLSDFFALIALAVAVDAGESIEALDRVKDSTLSISEPNMNSLRGFWSSGESACARG